jgi:hypothetical protein
MTWTVVDKSTGQPTTLTMEAWLPTWADARKDAYIATWQALTPGQDVKGTPFEQVWDAFLESNNLTMRDI